MKTTINKYRGILTLFVITLLLHIGCKETAPPDLKTTIASLTTPALQQAYLEKVYDEDQWIRLHKQAMEAKYGYQSDSVSLAGNEMQRIDLLNIDKIEAYLKAHGHPTMELHGSKAFETPIVVIHHSPHGFEHRKEHFKTFYDAFENNLGPLTMYLGRMFYVKYGENMNIEGRYTEEFEVDTLIRTLELTELLE